MRGFFVFCFCLFVHFESPFPLFLSNPLFILSFTLYEQSVHIDSWRHVGSVQLLSSLTQGFVVPPKVLDKIPELPEGPEPSPPKSLTEAHVFWKNHYDKHELFAENLLDSINAKLFCLLGQPASTWQAAMSDLPMMPYCGTIAFSGVLKCISRPSL